MSPFLPFRFLSILKRCQSVIFREIPGSSYVLKTARVQGCVRLPDYFSPAPQAEPQAAGFVSGLSPAPQAAGFVSGLSPAPQAVPQAAGFVSGLSPAPQAVPQAAGFVSGLSPAPQAEAGAAISCHPDKLESAIILPPFLFYRFLICLRLHCNPWTAIKKVRTFL